MRWLYPKTPSANVNLTQWLQRSLDFIPARSSVFLVTPVLSPESLRIDEICRPLSAKDLDLTVVLAESVSYLNYQGDPDTQWALSELKQVAPARIAALTDRLISTGARVYHLSGNVSLQTAMLRDASK